MFLASIVWLPTRIPLITFRQAVYATGNTSFRNLVSDLQGTDINDVLMSQVLNISFSVKLY
jgi:hypothetical protein